MFASVNEAKEHLLEKINAELKAQGHSDISTLNQAIYGWDPKLHYAMEWFQRHPPEGWHITCQYRHEVYEWTVTEK